MLSRPDRSQPHEYRLQAIPCAVSQNPSLRHFCPIANRLLRPVSKVIRPSRPDSKEVYRVLTDKVIRPSRSDLNPSLDIHSLTISSGENLPHWQCNDAIYHISFRLADSVPQSVRERWLRERECLIANAKQHGKELTEETERKAQYLYSEQNTWENPEKARLQNWQWQWR